MSLFLKVTNTANDFVEDILLQTCTPETQKNFLVVVITITYNT